MSAPFFSIITPIHNNGATIFDTLSSVKSQTMDDWEHLIVNDYSSDDSMAKALAFTQGDRRFRFLENTDKGGANVCRNIGLQNSKGQFLVFLDGDDLLHSTCLENRKKHLEGTGVQMLISQTLSYDTGSQKETGLFNCSPTISREWIIASFLKHKILWTTTGVSWEKHFLESIGGWNENYPRLQDVELNIRALLNNPRLGFTNCPDSYLVKSDFTKEKERNAFAGFNLLLRDYYGRVNETADCAQTDQLYSEAFGVHIQIIMQYWKNLPVGSNDPWGAFFLETVQEILEEADYRELKNMLTS
jgi:glycosyltransferase involved in cell wall biosynthesis